MKHAMTLLLCDGKLHYAPIGNNPGNIIDLGTSSHRYIRVKAAAKRLTSTCSGTGSGIWAIESQYCIMAYITRNSAEEAKLDVKWLKNTQAHSLWE
jgi:hypothetical protein